MDGLWVGGWMVIGGVDLNLLSPVVATIESRSQKLNSINQTTSKFFLLLHHPQYILPVIALSLTTSFNLSFLLAKSEKRRENRVNHCKIQARRNKTFDCLAAGLFRVCPSLLSLLLLHSVVVSGSTGGTTNLSLCAGLEVKNIEYYRVMDVILFEFRVPN